jgi:hypothetical protein
MLVVSAAMLPPSCPHHHCHHAAATATTTASVANLPLPPPSCRRLPLSTLQDKFDNEKEFCKNADIDCIQLS